jgi:hypothetical protein
VEGGAARAAFFILLGSGILNEERLETLTSGLSVRFVASAARAPVASVSPSLKGRFLRTS